MKTANGTPMQARPAPPYESLRAEYGERMAEVRRRFEASADGHAAVRERSALVDDLVQRLWAAEASIDGKLAKGIAIVAVGGYGRSELFPFSDIDLLFCAEKNEAEQAKDAIRRVSQALWDCGMRLSPATRKIAECERFSVGNAEFSLSLLDRRLVAGDEVTFERLDAKVSAKLMVRDLKQMRSEIAALTRERHKKYGDTLFHLEPNIKDCPGGLRDANVCGWLAQLSAESSKREAGEFDEALSFLIATRCFLHYMHERDDNSLDWGAQDAAAGRGIGLVYRSPEGVDTAYWMRTYFRYARVVERRLQWSLESHGLTLAKTETRKLSLPRPAAGFRMKDGRLVLDAAAPSDATAVSDPAAEPETVLALFAAMAKTGARLDLETEERIVDNIPRLSANLEEGPRLWRRLCAILTASFAGMALRAMHAMGLLELILPEFHGIDALVIRDAYHRYTVDEHTFVLVDTLHALDARPEPNAPEWRVTFRSMLRELQNPGLLYLAALLHDTGKGRAGAQHAIESASMARGVMARWEMDAYESGLVLRLIEVHLEMSAALRRDIFDADNVRRFAGRVQTHELLRMLTLFTYADIQAVHPDALTPWKAENLWRLSMNAANHIDRNVDEERVHTRGRVSLYDKDDRIVRILGMLHGREREAKRFLEGFPERYLKTRPAEAIRDHFERTLHFDQEPFQILFHHGSAASEITLVTRDRPLLFAGMSAALAAWGMNILTVEAYANQDGVVVDSFRFIDTFQTLKLNESERERFVASVRGIVSGKVSVEKMLSGRRGAKNRAPRMVVKTKIDIDQKASSHSTLMQVVAQDVTGLLRAISVTLGELGHNVEVALVDTEGETAIDVFYLTHDGEKLNAEQEAELRSALFAAIAANAG
jgi:[protein-PII] uridylyltransferase